MAFFWKKKRIYLDYAATTPVAPFVERAMKPFWSEQFGNASSIHAEGKQARMALRNARQQVAEALGVQSDEILFTSGGTESNNLAIQGVLNRAHRDGTAWEEMEVVTTSIEASSVLEVLKEYELKGVNVTYVGVNSEGVVRAEDVRDACTKKTILVTVQYVNNEIGTVQPIRKIGQLVKEISPYIVFHTDAAQAPLYHNINMHTLECDLISLDAQKMYGPKGIGVLGMRRGISIKPLFFGGEQEGGMRPGTENIAFVVGFAAAIKDATRNYKKRNERVSHVRDFLIRQLAEELPEAVLNGSQEKRTPSNVNISLPGVDTEYLTLALDAKGFAVSTKSACLSGTTTSHVVKALTNDADRTDHTLRITLGIETSKRDVEAFVNTLATLTQNK